MGLRMTKKLFITGTGTDVGKTYVSGLIVKKLHDAGIKTAYYKCALSGNIRDKDGKLVPGDALWVKERSRIEQDLATMCPYVYEAAASPHLASRLEGNPVRMDVVKKGFDTLCEEYDYVAVEGSGGIVCPIYFEETKILLEDIVQALDLACVIVADAGLGAINNVVLTVNYMQSKKIAIRGIIFNRYNAGNYIEKDNLTICEQLTGVPVVACVSEGDCEFGLEIDALKDLFIE